MRILAIDPGNELSAFCLVENGVPMRSGKLRNEELTENLRMARSSPRRWPSK
jgi:hypothetical protein